VTREPKGLERDDVAAMPLSGEVFRLVGASETSRARRDLNPIQRSCAPAGEKCRGHIIALATPSAPGHGYSRRRIQETQLTISATNSGSKSTRNRDPAYVKNFHGCPCRADCFCFIDSPRRVSIARQPGPTTRRSSTSSLPHDLIPRKRRSLSRKVIGRQASRRAL